jgi:hypothetical protein
MSILELVELLEIGTLITIGVMFRSHKMPCKFCGAADDFRLVISGVRYNGGSANLWQCNICKNIAAFRLPIVEQEYWDDFSYYDHEGLI